MKRFSTLITLAVVFAFAVQGTAGSGPVVNTDLVHIFSRIADADGNPLSAQSDPDTPLYTTVELEHQPVIAPDGHHVTLGEFLAADGQASVECTEEGTRADLELSGLIPNGVYSIWLFVFEEPGFDGTMANQIGAGAYGPYDEDQNVFTASAAGEGTISMVAPAGPLSVILPGASEAYGIGHCLLTDEYEFHLVGTYHIDHRTHGAMPGPVGSEAFQFGFFFTR